MLGVVLVRIGVRIPVRVGQVLDYFLVVGREILVSVDLGLGFVFLEVRGVVWLSVSQPCGVGDPLLHAPEHVSSLVADDQPPGSREASAQEHRSARRKPALFWFEGGPSGLRRLFDGRLGGGLKNAL
ncbi:MAG TPA: hypothetical protein VMG37_03495 [Solirubrobacteraceae bacterium]|nr:hypothetical protein [Solirubrobacteraceae bacterium]